MPGDAPRLDPGVLADELEIAVRLVERDHDPDAEAGGERAGEHRDELHPLGATVREDADENGTGGRNQYERSEDGERGHRLPRTTTNHASSSTTPTPMAAA